MTSGSVKQLPQKLDVTFFLALGLVTGRALLDHAELNSETFVLRRLAGHGTGSEESICQALAIVHAQSFCRLDIVFVFSKISQVSAKIHRTALGTCQCVPDQWKKAAHPAPRELNTTLRILREFQASTDTAQDVPMRRHDHMTTRG